MTYSFICENAECPEKDKEVLKDIPMKEYDNEVKNIKCVICGESLHRVFGGFGLKTFGDGYKS